MWRFSWADVDVLSPRRGRDAVSACEMEVPGVVRGSAGAFGFSYAERSTWRPASSARIPIRLCAAFTPRSLSAFLNSSYSIQPDRSTSRLSKKASTSFLGAS